jgi:uncharacterized membrane protein
LFPPENRFQSTGCIRPAAGFVSGIVPVWQGNSHTLASAFGSAAAGGQTGGKMINALAIVNRMDLVVASWTEVLKREKRNKMVALARAAPCRSATRRLRMSNSIEKRIELKAPVSVVWRALTDYREFGEWFRVKLDGPFVQGQVSHGRITYPAYEHLTWEATVQKMEPERLFSFTWHPYAIDPAVTTRGSRRLWSSSGSNRKTGAPF